MAVGLLGRQEVVVGLLGRQEVAGCRPSLGGEFHTLKPLLCVAVSEELLHQGIDGEVHSVACRRS